MLAIAISTSSARSSRRLRTGRASQVAQEYARAAPDRVVWGSDWPHRGEKQMPDDGELIDLLATWVPNEEVRRKILVENPTKLYGFA
jgi:D-galactarolactone isomerase